MSSAQLPGLSLVVPAYNEEERLPATLADLFDYFALRHWSNVEVIVVDDGSHDRTAALVDPLRNDYPNLKLVSYPHNQGKGHAVQQGILAATLEYVLIYDADGATPIAEIERFLPVWRETPEAIVIGSRSLAQASVHRKVALHRRLIGRCFNAMLRSLTPGIADTQCGFKGIPTAMAQAMVRHQTLKGFAFDVELLHIALHNHQQVIELPVNWVNQAGSKVNLISDSARMFLDLFRIARHSRAGDYDLQWPVLQENKLHTA